MCIRDRNQQDDFNHLLQAKQAYNLEDALKEMNDFSDDIINREGRYNIQLHDQYPTEKQTNMDKYDILYYENQDPNQTPTIEDSLNRMDKVYNMIQDSKTKQTVKNQNNTNTINNIYQQLPKGQQTYINHPIQVPVYDFNFPNVQQQVIVQEPQMINQNQNLGFFPNLIGQQQPIIYPQHHQQQPFQPAQQVYGQNVQVGIPVNPQDYQNNQKYQQLSQENAKFGFYQK
eukprot:TRINITY_DN2069_c0_g2_i4.p2 TRINITY_DN2069_c0_g2~~TRINITY_DN2069_c0_g2_i4.p2  ORF type:complete len:242 (-),score=40.33 TRINITY_DN2069_c0_g2_i4:108-794(-)